MTDARPGSRTLSGMGRRSPPPWRLSALWCVVLLALGCVGPRLSGHAPAHGVMSKWVERADATDRSERTAKPLIVAVTSEGLVAYDPVARRVRWRSTLEPVADVVVTDDAVIVPMSDQRVAVLERASGRTRWRRSLPGGAFRGVSATPRWIVASVQEDDGRSRVVTLSAHDGHVQWSRRSDAGFGAPLLRGRFLFLSSGRDVMAIRAGTGRVLARAELPPHESPLLEVRAAGSRIVAGSGTVWSDLVAPSARPVGASHVAGHRSFLRGDGLDAGWGEAHRQRIWIEASAYGGQPRHAVVLSRGALMSLRLDSDGRPRAAHWVTLAPPNVEFADFAVGGEEVWVALEGGRVWRLGATDGRRVDAPIRLPIEGRLRGWTHASLPLGEADPRRELNSELSTEALLELLARPNPRLADAQRMAIELLWRGPDPATREHVERVARGELVSDEAPHRDALTRFALDVLSAPWGDEDAGGRFELARGLAQRPGFRAGGAVADLGQLARRAVRSGSGRLTAQLGAHLLHPATPAHDLVEVARAIRALKDPDAIRAARQFLLRYHADREVVTESDAVLECAGFLGDMRDDPETEPRARRAAAEALAWVAEDPFSVPRLVVNLPRDSGYSVPRDDEQALSDSGV